MERGFASATSPEDFKGWVLGFYNEQSDELAKLPEMRGPAVSSGQVTGRYITRPKSRTMRVTG